MDTESEIQRLLAMEPDWNGYDDVPPNEIAANNARKAATALAVCNRPILFGAYAGGGINLKFYEGIRYADIECLNNGDIVGCLSIHEPNGAIDVWEINGDAELNEAANVIRQFLAA